MPAPPPRRCPRNEGNRGRCENASAGVGPRGVGGGWGDGFTAHETEVYPVPDDLSDDQAMMVEPLSIGLWAVLRRIPRPGERALILGGGLVGLNTVQCLRAVSPDCHITTAARYPQQVEMARRLGADEVVTGDGYQATARITGARLYEGMFHNRMLLGGYDVVYDCVGSARTVHDSLRWARAGGAVVMVGIHFAPAKLDLSPIWYQEVDLTGLCAHGIEPWEGGARRTRRPARPGRLGRGARASHAHRHLGRAHVVALVQQRPDRLQLQLRLQAADDSLLPVLASERDGHVLTAHDLDDIPIAGGVRRPDEHADHCVR